MTAISGLLQLRHERGDFDDRVVGVGRGHVVRCSGSTSRTFLLPSFSAAGRPTIR